ncbi:hypothetical protein [Paenibacillus montanisoli]|uniref:Uncharacterized protein n=1 Tax=Paenibacillus montanisoli TaxID=2081970 RepID=A0A328TVN3_9BACL|nr:hypothetical protein [Paenibacillus montanisoli]RAP74559.1 hypothetical protein DL346_21080 [Paenibacillus montanisoli]
MQNRDNHDDHYDEYYNETSNTAAGINTPRDHEDTSPLDLISHAIEEIVDNVQHAFDNDDDNDDADIDRTRYTNRADGHSF